MAVINDGWEILCERVFNPLAISEVGFLGWLLTVIFII